MTIHDDLHELLVEEADGPIATARGWDDVVARGVHRRRANRIRNGIVLVGLAVVVGAGVIAIPRSEREGVATGEPDASVGTRMQIDVTSARADDTSVTINMRAPSRPEAFTPCEGRPRALETDDQVRVEVVKGEGPSAWSYCEVFGERATGTFALDAPLAGRALIDGWDDTEVAVTEPPRFPTWLPAAFDLSRRIEEGQEFANPHGVLGWSLQYPSDDGELLLSIGTVLQDPEGCREEYVNLRWADAFYCKVSEDNARITAATLDQRVTVEVQREPGSSEPLPSKADLVKIANLLEPLEG